MRHAGRVLSQGDRVPISVNPPSVQKLEAPALETAEGAFANAPTWTCPEFCRPSQADSDSLELQRIALKGIWAGQAEFFSVASGSGSLRQG